MPMRWLPVFKQSEESCWIMGQCPLTRVVDLTISETSEGRLTSWQTTPGSGPKEITSLCLILGQSFNGSNMAQLTHLHTSSPRHVFLSKLVVRHMYTPHDSLVVGGAVSLGWNMLCEAVYIVRSAAAEALMVLTRSEMTRLSSAILIKGTVESLSKGIRILQNQRNVTRLLLTRQSTCIAAEGDAVSPSMAE